MRRCGACFALIKPGPGHSAERCKSSVVTLENLESALPLDLRMKMALKTIKEVVGDSGDTSVKLPCQSGGHHATIHIGPLPSYSMSPMPTLTVEECISIKVQADLSDNQLLIILKNLRIKFGFNAVEAHVRDMLTDGKLRFSSYFTGRRTWFHTTGKDMVKVERPFVWCHNILGLLSLLALLRDQEPKDLLQKVGVDNGKGHLQMIITLYCPDLLYRYFPARNRATRDDGIRDKHRSEMGVGKVIIIAIAPKVSESWLNVDIFFEATEIKKIVFSFTGDLKMIHICCGIGTSSSRHRCPYCEIANVKGQWGVFSPTGEFIKDAEARLRTYSQDLEHFQGFCEGGSKNAMSYMNVIALPLIGEDRPDEPTLLVTPPPQLHLFLLVNHILQGLLKEWPDLENWLAKKSLVFAPYHGTTLEGNECSRLLTYLDELDSVVPGHLRQFVKVLERFQLVVNSCFRYTVLPSYKDDIRKMRSAYRVLEEHFGISISNKLHIVFSHVETFLDLTGKGLGEFGEQSLETSHSAFAKVWRLFWVKDTDSDRYLERYLKVRSRSINAYQYQTF